LVRSFFLLFFSTVFVIQANNQRGQLDPAFQNVPFDQWLGSPGQKLFRSEVSVPHAELSFQQRLMGTVEIRLDGRDLEARRAHGTLLFLIQITDRDGTRYQNHASIELSKLDANIKAANIELSKRAFFLPGDYRLAVAIVDTASNEHSTIQEQFRVGAPRHELLPGAWRDLPPVEFIDDEQSPDNWFLPGIRGRLEWAASVHSRVQVNVVLNVAPAVTAPGSHSTTPSGGMGALIPTLKVISETGSPPISEHVELLDLARRRAVFQQKDVHDVDWPRLKESLSEADTASIDVHSLSERHRDAQFFVSQVRSLIRASEQPCVLVVLTRPVAFDPGEDLDPISLEALPPCRLFYIRYHAPVQTPGPYAQMGGRGRGSRMGGPMNRNRLPQDVIDQLEATLKPLAPRVFDVETPEQMAKALSEIEKVSSGF
jgi:hypothetical protein